MSVHSLLSERRSGNLTKLRKLKENKLLYFLYKMNNVKNVQCKTYNRTWSPKNQQYIEQTISIRLSKLLRYSTLRA